MSGNTSAYGRLVAVIIFSLASAVLGYVKLPGPATSIALDSAPGYFSAGYFSPLIGGLVGSLGHLASAAVGGFPLGWLHLVVAVQMFFWCGAFGFVIRSIDKRWAVIPAALVGVVLNGIAGPLMLGALGLMPMNAARSFVPFLVAASAVNIIFASIGIIAMARRRIPGL
jgi:hypothetical protein